MVYSVYAPGGSSDDDDTNPGDAEEDGADDAIDEVCTMCVIQLVCVHWRYLISFNRILSLLCCKLSPFHGKYVRFMHVNIFPLAMLYD